MYCILFIALDLYSKLQYKGEKKVASGRIIANTESCTNELHHTEILATMRDCLTLPSLPYGSPMARERTAVYYKSEP
jgi:hypothetical protein